MLSVQHILPVFPRLNSISAQSASALFTFNVQAQNNCVSGRVGHTKSITNRAKCKQLQLFPDRNKNK